MASKKSKPPRLDTTEELSLKNTLLHYSNMKTASIFIKHILDTFVMYYDIARNIQVLYVNDLHLELEHCRVLMYADDTVIFYSNASSKNIEEIINKEVQRVADWLRENILVINLKKGKTEFVLYGTAKRLKNAPCVKVEINGIEVTNNEVYEYLGVHVDKTLSFLEQFDKIYRKAAKRLGLLHRIRQKLSTQAAESIYRSIVKPSLTYCDTVLLC